MGVFIALYRGINVGGKNLVSMESLRALHGRLGHRDLKNHIQSGNIVFSAGGSAEDIAEKLATAFADAFGFAAKVMVVDAKRWGGIVRNNPYSKFAAVDPKTVHAGICAGEPSAGGLKALSAKIGGPETFVIAKGMVYLHAPAGTGTSKFAAAMEKASGVPMTLRNWRTIEALWKLANPAG